MLSRKTCDEKAQISFHTSPLGADRTCHGWVTSCHCTSRDLAKGHLRRMLRRDPVIEMQSTSRGIIFVLGDWTTVRSALSSARK